MKQIKILDAPSFNDFIDNIEQHSKEFISNVVVAYRGANFSKEEQYKIMQKIGDTLNWYPKTGYDYVGKTYYQENHSRKYVKDPTRTDPEKILLSFHMEHTDYINPMVGATWNMYLFTGDSKNGRTAFVDTSELYKTMPEDWQKFLSNCVEIIKKDVKISDTEYEMQSHRIKCVENHWFDNTPTIRIDLDTQENTEGIEFLDGKEVTKDDLVLFQKIKNFVFNQILNNEDIRWYHEWQQGDLVIVDLFKMAHAVYGGFLPEEREFCGYWAYRSEITDKW